MSEAVITYRRLGERPARDFVTGVWTRRIRSASLALMVAGIVAALIALPSLPAEIPVHFGATGAADRWGGRGELLILLVVWAVLQFGVDALSRRPRLVNYPGPVTSANVQRLYRAGEQMLVWLSAAVAVVFLALTGMMLGLATGALLVVGLVGTLAATFVGTARLNT